MPSAVVTNMAWRKLLNNWRCRLNVQPVLQGSEIWGAVFGGDDESGLLGCYILSLGQRFHTFRRIVLSFIVKGQEVVEGGGQSKRRESLAQRHSVYFRVYWCVGTCILSGHLYTDVWTPVYWCVGTCILMCGHLYTDVWTPVDSCCNVQISQLINRIITLKFLYIISLTLWRRNFLLNFSTPCI
jgi:hypothetical protein